MIGVASSELLPGKTLENFDFDAVPMISKAHVAALCAGDSWLEKGANLILIGPPDGGKSHLSSAIGLALLEKGYRVLFSRTSDLVQKLQVARRELALEAAIQRLERFDLLVLDDLAYVAKDQAETSVLFELISARYEQRSLLITANQPFGEWGKVFTRTRSACQRQTTSCMIVVPRHHSHPVCRAPHPDRRATRSDDGLVFTSRSYTALVRGYGLRQEFITPHSPEQNGIVERLIRTLKEQCAHRHRFETL